MSILVHAEVDGDRLSDDEIVQESLLILIGGDETTRHVISGGIHQLLLHPDQWERLADDPSARPAAVEEMLRWVSPIKNMVRTATRDVELRGQQIHEGDELMLLYPSANRDEDVFDDPFRFDIARTPERARGLRVRHPLLPRRQPGPPRDRGDARRAARPHAEPAPRRPRRRHPSSAPPTSSAASSTSRSSGEPRRLCRTVRRIATHVSAQTSGSRTRGGRRRRPGGPLGRSSGRGGGRGTGGRRGGRRGRPAWSSTARRPGRRRRGGRRCRRGSRPSPRLVSGA